MTNGILHKIYLVFARGGGHIRLSEIRLHSWVVSFIEKDSERGGLGAILA